MENGRRFCLGKGAEKRKVKEPGMSRSGARSWWGKNSDVQCETLESGRLVSVENLGRNKVPRYSTFMISIPSSKAIHWPSPENEGPSPAHQLPSGSEQFTLTGEP